MFNQLKNVLLFVTDLDQAVRFYRDALGLKVKTQEEGYVEFDLPGTLLSVIDVPEASKMISQEAVSVTKDRGHSFAIAVQVPDVDRAYEELKVKGAEFIKVPFTQPWGQRTAYFEDPDGHLWEIHS